MKGISIALEIVIAIVILLAVAVVVLTFFGVNIGNVGNLLSEWIGSAKEAPITTCQSITNIKECTFFRGCQVCPKDNTIHPEDRDKCRNIGGCMPAPKTS